MRGEWPNANGGDRVLLTDELMAACLVKTLRKLKEEAKLITEFPNLETVLRGATPKTEARDSDCRGMDQQWWKGDPEGSKRGIDEDEEDPYGEDDDTPGFEEVEADEDLQNHRSFTISRAWKEYTAYRRVAFPAWIEASQVT
ncbi:hypothetical protein BC835DRAFT_1411843 [Cytidiella melzeri]|nr:hypothetical protein BC835DRAFT_1411843 [Cytidiella melzeri]